MCSSYTWTTTHPGTVFFLALLGVTQLVGAVWSVLETANDKLDGFEKAMTFLLEAASSA